MWPTVYQPEQPFNLPLAQPLGDGLALYLPLQGGGGKNVYGASIYNQSGTLYGNACFKSGPCGWVLDFDGNGDYVEFADSAPLRPASAFTISAWVRRRQYGQQQGIVSKFTWGSYGYKIEYGSNDKLIVALTKSDSTSMQQASAASVLDSKWHHTVGVWNGSQIYNVLDGVQSAAAAANNGIRHDVNRKLYIGALLNNLKYLDGQIANVRIYSRALSMPEILRLYETGS